MSDTDDTKEIPTRQVPDQHAAWRISEDEHGGDFCVLTQDGQVVAVTFPIAGDRLNGSDSRARALCIAKAPEMQRLLSQAQDSNHHFNVHAWLSEVEALLARTK